MRRIPPSDNPLVPSPEIVKAARALAELLRPNVAGARLSLLDPPAAAPPS